MSRWPQEKIDRLKVLWREGHSAGRIAELLGCGLTRNAVIGQVHRRGLLKRTTVHERPRWQTQTHAHRCIMPRVVPEPELHEAEVIPPLEPILKPVREARLPRPTTAPKSKQITILQLKNRHCRWPGDDYPLTTFCGADRLINSSYCAFHDQLSRGSGTPSERRAVGTALAAS